MNVLARTLPRAAGWPIWLLGAIAVLLCSGVVVGVAVYSWVKQEAAIENSKRELKNAALLLSEHTSRAVHAVALSQTNILTFIRSTGATTPQQFRERLSQRDVHELFRHQLSGHPQVNAFTVIDADGNLLNFTRTWPVPRVNLSDRAYFQTLKSTPTMTELITEPVRNRGDGTWTVYVARKITAPSGEFLGLVLGALDLGYFETLFAAVDLDSSNVFALFRADGTLLARWPRLEAAIGNRYPNSIRAMGSNASAVFEFDAPTDGVRRLIGAHRVRNYPLFVTAGVDKEHALSSWRNETMMLAATAAIACVVIAALLGLTMWSLTRLRRRDHEQLAGKEEQLAAALNNMAHGLAMFDVSGRIVLCNESYGEILGLPRELARPGTMLEDVIAYRMAHGFASGEQRAALERVFADLAEGRTSVQLVETIDGRTLRVIDRPKPGGGWVATFEDITLQSQAERERDQNQAFLKAVLDSVPSAIFVKDARTLRYVFVNKTAERYLNGTRQALQGKAAADAFPIEAAAQIAQRDREALQNRMSTTSEGHLLETSAIGIRTVNATRVPILESNGEPQFLLGVIEDVTDRRRAEAAERQNAALLAATIAAMVDSVIVVDADGQVLLSNPAAAAMFGDGIHLPGSTWIDGFERLRPDGMPLPAEESPVHRAMRGEVVDNCDLLLKRRSDGEQLHLMVSSRPLRDEGGVLQSVMVYRDVTESREVERQLRQAQKMDAIGQLTGGIAHDFNNILTVITTTIDILADAVAEQPTALTITNMISQAADRGTQLTKHLLAFARKQPLQPRDTDVNALVMETTSLLKASLGEHIKINAALDQDAWHALIDPSQLTTALLNLAVNARDAMPDGGTLTIETSNVSHPQEHAAEWDVPEGEYMMLAVTDTGTGIPEAIRDKVFDPFFTTKGAGKGTGLGLSMVYGFVKQSGGQIRIYSEEGHGTTIRIYLPRAAASPLAALADAQDAPGGHEVVLVVEDDPLVRQQATRLLSSLGYSPIEAASPTEALAMIDAGTEFDLMFSDVIMPGMNGWQLFEQVRQRRPDTRVLFASGYTENTMLSEERIPTDVLLLSKPYKRHDLARAIRQALARPAISSAA